MKKLILSVLLCIPISLYCMEEGESSVSEITATLAALEITANPAALEIIEKIKTLAQKKFLGGYSNFERMILESGMRKRL